MFEIERRIVIAQCIDDYEGESKSFIGIRGQCIERLVACFEGAEPFSLESVTRFIAERISLGYEDIDCWDFRSTERTQRFQCTREVFLQRIRRDAQFRSRRRTAEIVVKHFLDFLVQEILIRHDEFLEILHRRSTHGSHEHLFPCAQLPLGY